MIHCVTHNMFILCCVEMGPGRIAFLTAKNGCAQCGAWTLCTGDTVYRAVSLDVDCVKNHDAFCVG